LSGAADTVLLGRFFGAEVVGIYSRGMALLMRPMTYFMAPLDRVCVPVFSRLQNDPGRYRRTFLQTYEAILLASFLVGGLLLALARPIVLLLLGQRWAAVVPVFSATAIAAIYVPAAYSCTWLLTTQGRTKDIVSFGLADAAILITAIVIGLPFGATAVAFAFSLSGLMMRLPVQYYIVGRAGPVTSRDMWAPFIKHLPIWIAAFAVTRLLMLLFPTAAPAAQLLICAPVGLIAATALAFCLPASRCIALHFVDIAAKQVRRAP
jgi:PST family polysaccharide transporter